MSARDVSVKSTGSRISPGLITLVVCVLAWEGLSLLTLPTVLPGPLVLLQRIIKIYSDPASYLIVGRTLLRILEGFVIVMVVGTSLGLLMGLKRNIELFFDSWIMVLLTVPAVCWAFLSVLWFGISDAAPILTIVLVVSAFVVMNVWQGTKAMEKNLFEMATVFKARRGLMLRKVFIPQLMPYIVSSLRIALSLSWKMALVAEAFGAGNGVGQELINWFQETRVDMMMAWGVSFMLIMVLIDVVLFRLLSRRAFAWRPQLAV
jgi:NitT/TauT family transport system permease protein